jgi:hypothetical protein
MSKYTTLAKIENYLLVDVDETFHDQIDEWIENMSEYIELETGRVFEADTEATTRKYEITKKETDTIGKYLGSVKSLQIDDCVEIESIIIDDDEIDGDDYITYPANSTPITRIKLTDDSGLTFSEGEQNIEVSAKWGYSADPPGDIVFACTVLTAGVINNSWSHEGEVKSVSMGSYSLVFKDEQGLKDFERVEQILRKYKKVDL